MSLDWDIGNCKNYEEITMNQEVEGAKTEQIVWSSLFIKLGDITEKIDNDTICLSNKWNERLMKGY